jgi:hypothetical protein
MTPYEQVKGSGQRSSFYSPDGFVKIEEFESGERYLHSPLIGYPVRLRNSTPQRRRQHERQS